MDAGSGLRRRYLRRASPSDRWLLAGVLLFFVVTRVFLWFVLSGSLLAFGALAVSMGLLDTLLKFQPAASGRRS
jgi:hypothetical protein